MNDEYVNWETLTKYVTGQCSHREEEVIHEWMQMDSKHEEFVLFLRKIWTNSSQPDDDWDVDASWERLNEEYDLPFARKQLSVTRKRYKNGWYRWAAVAASAAIVVFTLFSLDLILPGEPTDEVAYREIITNNGQRTHLNLNDGSTVVLNAGSKLILPETFNGLSSRDIQLTGEAWFEVAHDPDRPFTVYTKNAITKVLGTKFQVTSYPEDNRMQVVVTEGKVAIQGLENSYDSAQTLTQYQKGILYNGGLSTVSRVNDTSVYLGWIEGELVFHEDSLPEVVKKLERWYDIEIQIDPAMQNPGQKQLSATFSVNQPMREVLEGIALTLDIDYRGMENASMFLFF